MGNVSHQSREHFISNRIAFGLWDMVINFRSLDVYLFPNKDKRFSFITNTSLTTLK